MIITFNNYQIRDYRIEDIESLVKYANNYNVIKFLRNSFPFPYTKADAEKWIDYVLMNPESVIFAIADSNELIGSISAVPPDEVNKYVAEVGFWIGEPFWNKGILSNALNVFANYLFSNYQLNRLTAKVYEGNDSSKRVLEKNGFILESTTKKNINKEDKFLDQYTYGLLKENFRYDPKSS